MTALMSSIIQLRFEGKSFRAVSEAVNLSHERVRQMFDSALKLDASLRKQWIQYTKKKTLKDDPHTAEQRSLIKRYGKNALRMNIQKCLGCGGKFNATDMRTHKCKVAWYKRIGADWHMVEARKSAA